MLILFLLPYASLKRFIIKTLFGFKLYCYIYSRFCLLKSSRKNILNADNVYRQRNVGGQHVAFCHEYS